MAKLFIFGIGGTGARVLRSLNMVLAANAGNLGDTTIVPLIIDYDVENGDKDRTLTLMSDYASLNKGIYEGTTYQGDVRPDGFFATPMKTMQEVSTDEGEHTSTFAFRYNPPVSEKTYSESIGFRALSGENQITQFLLETLYNETTNQEFAELHIDTTVGFRGNPNIGSVLLSDIKQTPEFKDFITLCNGDNGDRAVVIGSLFGGTGASGIPVLVNAIKTDDRPRINRTRVATILVGPYFKIGQPDEKTRNEGVIDDKIFESKTKAALYFYEDSLNQDIDAIYYFGDTKKNQVEHNIGKEAQKNNAHVVELVAAMAVAHFNSLEEGVFNERENDGVTRRNHWKYGFSKDILEQNILDFSMFAKETYADLRKMCAYALSGKALAEYLEKGKDNSSNSAFFKLSGFNKSENQKNANQKKFIAVYTEFMNFFEKFKKWASELENGSDHKLSNFNFEAKELCDILGSHPFRHPEKKLKYVGKEEMKPNFDINDLITKFNETYAKHMKEGSSEELKPEQTLQYAFFEGLYQACNFIIDKNSIFDKLQQENAQ